MVPTKRKAAQGSELVADLPERRKVRVETVSKYGLLGLSSIDVDQNVWQTYRDSCEAMAKTNLEEPGDYELSPGLCSNVKAVLDGIPGLTPDEVKLLRRSTVIVSAGVDWAELDDVRELDIYARVFSVDGPNCVDLYHSYHHRPRWDTVEHFADVKCRVQTPFSEKDIAEASTAEDAEWQETNFEKMIEEQRQLEAEEDEEDGDEGW